MIRGASLVIPWYSAASSGCQPSLPEGVGAHCEATADCETELVCVEHVAPESQGDPDVAALVHTCQVPCTTHADCRFQGRSAREENCAGGSPSDFCVRGEVK